MMIAGVLLLFAVQAVSAAEPEPVTANCIPVGEVESGQVLSLDLRCPGDVPDAVSLQTYASNVAEQMAMPVDLSVPYTNVAEEVLFVFREGAWTLPEPVPFTRTPPIYPRRAAIGSREGKCDMRAMISDVGRAEDVAVACTAYRTSGRPTSRGEMFEETAAAALRSWRYFAPLDRNSRCITTALTFTLGHGEGDPDWGDQPVEGAPVCPATPDNGVEMRDDL